MPHGVNDAALRDRLLAMQRRLEQGLPAADPHHRLAGRPVSYQVIAGQTFEITYRDVTRIDETEVRGVKRLIGENCHWSVTPQGRETITVRFVVPITEGS
jgi:hypothetical protein